MIKKIFGFLKSNEPQPSLTELANSYGIERRRAPRIVYPPVNSGIILPKIEFEDFQVQVKDVSAGGFCLCSNALTEQLTVGEEYHFSLCWNDKKSSRVEVRAKHIAVSFEKLHFQFQELSESTNELLQGSVEFAKRGMEMRSSFLGVNEGINTQIKEIWVNSKNDKLVIHTHDSPWVDCEFLDQEIKISKGSASTELDSLERSKFLVFLANIPSPSDDLKELVGQLSKPSTKKESA